MKETTTKKTNNEEHQSYKHAKKHVFRDMQQNDHPYQTHPEQKEKKMRYTKPKSEKNSLNQKHAWY